MAVDPTGDRAVVTAVLNDGDGLDAGAAYVSQHSDGGWSDPQRLPVSDLAERAAFGAWASLSDDLLVVGAPGNDETPGAAYVYLWPLFADGFECGACSMWSREWP